MPKSIYVGNLSFGTNASGLEALFSRYGEVTKTKIVRDPETDRSRGFGFVEMSDDAAATAAIEALDGQDFEGRPLKVNEARPREERPRRDTGERGNSRQYGNRRDTGHRGKYD